MNCQVCGTNNAPDTLTCATCGLPLTATPPAPTEALLSLSPALPAGTKLRKGAYTIGNVLGQGGFGITYKGADMRLRRFVAIKEFYPPGCTRQPSLPSIVPAGGSDNEYAASKTRFLEEGRLLARFNHAGIVRVFGIFEENNTAYMVMEFLEGQTLGERLKEGPLSEREATELMAKLGDALKVIHRARLIHCDLKPDNIFLANGGRVVLIDFGTARTCEGNPTFQQTAMLTPGYAPLEQYGSSSRFGPYSDVYALAATLYHAVTGQTPPPATDRATGVEMQRADLINPNLSPTLGLATEWGMQLKAEHRPQNIAEFLGALSGKTPINPPHSQSAPTGAPLSSATARAQAVLPPGIAPQTPFSPSVPSPAPPPPYIPRRPVQGGKGALVLVAGILTLLFCGIPGPIAWVLGNSALKEYGSQDPGDRGLVTVGRIMGIIGSCFLLFVVIMGIVITTGS